MVIPYYGSGSVATNRLLDCIPEEMPVLFVDDLSEIPLEQEILHRKTNVQVVRLEKKGYFAGAVNYGLTHTTGDVLVLNHDIHFRTREWLDLLEKYKNVDIWGDGVMNHPAWPYGYVQGTFMHIKRRVIEGIGLLDEIRWPLWGGTCEYQTRACRAGYSALPLFIPGMEHARKGNRFGLSIERLLSKEPTKKSLLIRTPPLVSVIVPCHNYGRYLLDCINSLIGGTTSLGEFPPQTIGAAFEVIIVDDASTDSTMEIGKSLADDSKGIHYYRMKENVGTARALNFGISKSYGRYTTFLSADDMREPQALEVLYDACEGSPHSFVYDDVRIFDKNGRGDRWLKPPEQKDYDLDKLLYKNYIHAGIMYPRQAWEEVKGYPALMDDGREDWAINIALGLAGYCGKHIAQSNYLYRREMQNRSLRNTSPEHHEYFLGKLQRAFPDAYKGVFPMGCCGKKGSAAPAAQSNGLERSYTMVGSNGMTQLQYTGNKMGSTTRVGESTNTVYRFSGAKRKGWVDNGDVGVRGQSGLLNIKENGTWAFELVPEGADVSFKPVKTEEAEPAPVKETRGEEVSVPDPSTMTVQEIVNLDLPPEGWATLYKIEKAGKQRITVLKYAEEHSAVEQAKA